MKKLWWLLLALPQTAWAQEQFIVRLGNDTIAVETFSLTENRLEGELVTRGAGGKTHYVVDLTHGVATTMQVEMTPQGSDSVTLSATISFRGDSAFAQLNRSGVLQPEQRLASAFRAVPFVNLATGFFELALLQAPRTVGDSTTVNFFSVGNGAVMPATLHRAAADSVALRMGPLEIHFRVDAEGRIQHGAVPAQNVTIERVAGIVQGNAAPAVRPRPSALASEVRAETVR